MPEQPVVFEPKKIPTQIKHWILERCLIAWGGICVNSNQGEVRFSFIDTCCGSGLYRSSSENEAADGVCEIGSALIGPQALAEISSHARRLGKPVKARALLVNSDANELETARAVIRSAGLDTALDAIEFLEGTLEDAQEEVARHARDWFTFVFIDPYGPKPTPFTVVSTIVAGRYTDTLINFPYYSFHKWTGFLDKTPSGDQEAKLRAADAFMGGPDWRDVARSAIESGTPLEKVLVEYYSRRLESLGVMVLSLPLMFQDKKRVMYHLLFTSHNVAGLESAKEKFQEGEDRQYTLRQDLEAKRTGMGFLFDQGPENAADVEGLAQTLEDGFRGSTATMERVILEGLRLRGVLGKDVRKALTRLRAQGRIQRTGTGYHDEVRFLA